MPKHKKKKHRRYTPSIKRPSRPRTHSPHHPNHRRVTGNKRYTNSSRYSDNEPLTYKDTFFFQVTACGIITLGILVLVMFSPNSYAIRNQIVHTIHTADVWSFAVLTPPETVMQNNSTAQPEHIAEDFRIDERLLDDVAFRRNNHPAMSEVVAYAEVSGD